MYAALRKTAFRTGITRSSISPSARPERSGGLNGACQTSKKRPNPVFLNFPPPLSACADAESSPLEPTSQSTGTGRRCALLQHHPALLDVLSRNRRSCRWCFSAMAAPFSPLRRPGSRVSLAALFFSHSCPTPAVCFSCRNSNLALFRRGTGRFPITLHLPGGIDAP